MSGNYEFPKIQDCLDELVKEFGKENVKLEYYKDDDRELGRRKEYKLQWVSISGIKYYKEK